MSQMEFIFRAIGVLSTPYTSKSGVPIQGIFAPESRGRAEIFEAYEEGLKDIEGFSHLILLYAFHQSGGYDLVCKPYLEDKPHGIFAIRAPNRPNPIGLSVVRLEKRAGNILHLAEVDMLDGTPLLDIKPFVPEFDQRENVRVGWMERAFREVKEPPFSDDRF